MTNFGDLHLDRGRKSTVEIAALRRLVIPMAQSLLEKKSENLKSLMQLGEQCRQIGALSEAAEIFDRLATLDPDNPHAERMHGIFEGDPPNKWSKYTGPIPFVRIQNIFDDQVHDSLLTQALSDLEKFKDATVYNFESPNSTANPNLRRGKMLASDRVPIYQKQFLPKLKSIVRSENILDRLGFSSIPKLRFELQVTNYSDGEFFARHVDDGSPSLKNRKISYVYYMRRAESEFAGGDLLLYDSPAAANRRPTQAYTRVRPLDNSIVFFPSSSLHEVSPTFVKSGSRQDGRFSINGWLVAVE